MRRVAAALSAAALLSVAACETSTPDDAESTDLPALELAVVATIASPSGEMVIEVGLVEGGTAAYRVVSAHGDEREAVGLSLLGMQTSAGSLLDGLTLADAGTDEVWSDSFELPVGKRTRHTLQGTARSLSFIGEAELALDIDLIATDGAVAIRQRVERSDNSTQLDAPLSIGYERFELTLDADSDVWMQARDRADQYRPAYERLRSQARSLSSIRSSGNGWNFPLLAESDGLWLLATEAGLGEGLPASHLRSSSGDGRFFVALPSDDEGNGVGDPAPVGTAPITMPWRVVIASDDIGDIVESDVVRHLSAPNPAPERDFSWVEPGRVSWSWWSDPDSPKDPESLVDFIELSAALDWEYSLIDANWNEMTGEQFAAVVDAADAAGVGLFLWYNSGGPHNTVTEAPRGRMSSRVERRTEMERIADLGVRGIKVDFFQSDKPASIDLYLDILEDAADFELLVNFHGSTLPRGWSRTWPNLMTMESVPGAEQYIFNPGYAAQAPSHNALLAYTRNVVGSMDYTPTMLGNTRLHRTTSAHELALAVVFESGLTHFVDTPEVYLDQVDAVTGVLREVPVAWDDIVFLDGDPRTHVAIARRSGDEWWIGAINGTDDPITIELDDQLTEFGDETVRICDGEVGDEVLVENGATGALQLAGAGGCVVRLAAR